MADDWSAFPAEQPATSAAADWSAFPAADQPALTEAPKPDFPWYSRAAYGLADPMVGLTQLGAHAVGAGEGFDQLVANREAGYQQQRDAAGQNGADWARLGGNVASPVNFIPGGRAGSLGARVLGGAEAGALSSVAQPVTSGQDYLSAKTDQAGSGAAIGAALGPVAGVVRGARSPDVQALEDAGVALTPGQSGGMIAKANEALASRLPILKNVVAGHQENAINSFNTATLNEALKPIGAELPASTVPGHEALAAAHEQVGNFYNRLMPKLTFAADDPFLSGYIQIEGKVPVSQRAQFTSLTSPAITDQLGGDALKSLDSDLATWAARYGRSGAMNPEHEALGDALSDVRGLMRQQMARINPEAAADLSAADKSYAMLRTAENAAASAGRQEGVFTPGQLIDASRRARGTSERQFVQGGGLLQPLAEAGQRVIGSGRGAGRSPATAADLLTTDILGTAIGLGGVGLGSSGEGGGDWSKLGYLAAPALAMTRPGAGLLSTLGPTGMVRRSSAGLLAPGAGAVTGGLLGRQ